jgi:hypothetical protein
LINQCILVATLWDSNQVALRRELMEREASRVSGIMLPSSDVTQKYSLQVQGGKIYEL